jgi:hypothetical protein
MQKAPDDDLIIETGVMGPYPPNQSDTMFSLVCQPFWYHGSSSKII